MTVPSLDQLQKDADAISAASPNTRRFAEDVVAYLRSLAPAPPPPSSGRWFTSGSWVNTPLPSSPAIDPGSSGYQAVIRQSQSIWGNGITAGGAWGTAVYHATASTPQLTVTVGDPVFESITFPCDSSWKPSPDSDGHLASILPNDSYFAFQAIDLAAKHAHMVERGNVTTGDGVPAPGNAVAPLPLLAGMIRPEEIAAGVIPHALRLGVPWASKAVRWPAIWSDGGTVGGPPSGARLWLPAVPSGLNREQTIVCQAFHTYGGLIGDASGSFAVYFQSTADGKTTYPFASFSLPASVVSALVVLA